jgi:hypothetical protein
MVLEIRAILVAAARLERKGRRRYSPAIFLL